MAMMAARLGARHVVTVEANSSLAAVARRNVARNGLADRVTVLHGLSTDLHPRDLPCPPTGQVGEVAWTVVVGGGSV